MAITRLRNTDVRTILAKIGQASTTNISAATNATPIVLTSTAHGLSTGDKVVVVNVGGNTAANGVWSVTVSDANTVTLTGSVGNGGYTSGGTIRRLYANISIEDVQNLSDALNRTPCTDLTATIQTKLEGLTTL